VVVVFDIVPADGYAVLKPSVKDSTDYLAKMNDGMEFWQAGRGVSLESRWNDQWEFVIDKSFDHSRGIGDLAEMNRLIAAQHEAFEILAPLVGDAAEILKGRYNGVDLCLFNITRKVAKADIAALEDTAIFRVNPAGVSILCGPGFKDAVERNGLTSLRFREAQEKALI